MFHCRPSAGFEPPGNPTGVGTEVNTDYADVQGFTLPRDPLVLDLLANRFIALQGQDSNGDGQVNSQDASYTQLRVWRDLNQDGISQAGELQTLSQAGIASIGVAGTTSNVNLGNGNTQIASGSFTRTNGSSGQSGVAELTGSKKRYLISSCFRNILKGYKSKTCINGCTLPRKRTGEIRNQFGLQNLKRFHPRLKREQDCFNFIGSTI